MTRRGIALYAALALMAVLGLFTAGAVASLAVAQRSARLAQTDARVAAAAGDGLGAVLAQPAAYGLADLELGRAHTFTVTTSDGTHSSVSATRLPGGVLWLVALASRAGVDSGQRRASLVARYPWVGPIPAAGVIARGGVSARSDVVFQEDTARDADCAGAPSYDVMSAPGGAVSVAPGVTTAASAVASDTTTYLLTAAQLARLDSAGVVTHVRGDTTIAGGTFDGILIADGAIVVTGAFSLTGVMIARDSLVAAGGVTVRGALMSFSPAPVAVRLGGATIVHAPCVVARAFRRAARLRAVRGRAWAELF